MSPSPDAQLASPPRLALLRRTGLLDSAPEEAFDRLARLAARLLKAPVSLVSLVAGDRQFFKSHIGLKDISETPLTHSFCQHVVSSRESLIVEDARTHPLVAQNPAITDLGVIAYAGVPLTTSYGEVLGAFCAIDVQARKWTEEEVEILRDLAASVTTEIELRLAAGESGRQARERETLLESTSEGIYGMDPQGHCTFVNRAAVRLLGYSAEEMLGRDMHELVHHSHPDGSPYPAPECPIMTASLSGQSCRIDTEVFWRKDGTSFPAEYACAPMWENGALKGSVITFTDITERKQMEARLEAAYLREKRIAGEFQEMLLPRMAWDAFDGLEVRTRYLAAWAEAQVGGDFYDGLTLPDGRVALIVGDVSGKGLVAATRTAEVRYMLRALLHLYPDPHEVVSRLNDILCALAEPDENLVETFTVLSLAVVDTGAGVATFVEAGGEPPVLLRGKTGAVDVIEEGGLPLGVEPHQSYPSMTMPFAPGDVLLMVTDGITEARHGLNFLSHEGLLAIVQEARSSSGSLSEMAQMILDSARAFAGGTLRDDACLLLSGYRG